MIKLNDKNFRLIYNYVYGIIHEISNSKIEALYKLIQLKGTPINSFTNVFIKDTKQLQISEDEYIVMIHSPSQSNSFFPCVIQTFIIKKLSTYHE